jgi:hypothetical protein
MKKESGDTDGRDKHGWTRMGYDERKERWDTGAMGRPLHQACPSLCVRVHPCLGSRCRLGGTVVVMELIAAAGKDLP